MFKQYFNALHFATRNENLLSVLILHFQKFQLFLKMAHPDGHRIIDRMTSYFTWLIVLLCLTILAQPGGQIGVLIYCNKIICVEICNRAYESQHRCSLPRFLVLPHVTHLRDEFRNFIPKSERYSNMPYFRIVGWIWWRYNPYRYNIKFISSYFPSTEVHPDYSVNLNFVSKIDEQNKTQNWCAVVLS